MTELDKEKVQKCIIDYLQKEFMGMSTENLVY